MSSVSRDEKRLALSGNSTFRILPVFLITSFLLLLLLMELPDGATTQTYYADAVNGNDNYDGLAAVFDGTHGPKQTLQATMTAAVHGSTVIAAPGTYPENIAFTG